MKKAQKTEQAQTAKKDLVPLTAVPVSLGVALDEKLPDAGFSSRSEGVRTMLRDFIAGKIQYTNGILQNQGQLA